jgi:uncharacterized protein
LQLKHYRLASCPAPIRLGVFLLTLVLLWIPLAAPIYWLGRDQNSVTILTMGLLFAEFLLLVRFWGHKVYRQPHLLKSYGLVTTRQNGLELLAGLGIGLFLILSLFGLEGILGWLVWQQLEDSFARVILEGLGSALLVGLAEELVFRGWLLDELQRDYRPRVVVWANAVIFALLHFLKPLQAMLRSLPTFPALVLFGLIMVWAKQGSQGRLGLPIGLHMGLFWGYYIINVGQLVEYSGKVPDWITGVNGNPLIGVMGLLFLGLLAFGMKWRIRQRKNTD